MLNNNKEIPRKLHLLCDKVKEMHTEYVGITLLILISWTKTVKVSMSDNKFSIFGSPT